MTIVTIAERKRRAVARLQAAATSVRSEIGAYAARHDVRFVVFGSFARGEVVETSDLDVMIEGHGGDLLAARSFVEECCERHGLRPDVHLSPEVSAALMSRIRRDGILIA